MANKTESGLAMNEVAQSAFRVFCAITGVLTPWEDLPTQQRVSYLNLAESAEAALNKYEGKSWAEVAQEIYRLFCDGSPAKQFLLWEPMTVFQKLIWEATARHLTCLFDSDEVDDLPELEASWKTWAHKSFIGKLPNHQEGDSE